MPIEVDVGFSPRGSTKSIPIGGVYAKDASGLRSNWLCGGSLDFQAASGDRSSHTVSFAGSSVKQVFSGLGARPVAPPFRQARAHCFLSPA